MGGPLGWDPDPDGGIGVGSPDVTRIHAQRLEHLLQLGTLFGLDPCLLLRRPVPALARRGEFLNMGASVIELKLDPGRQANRIV